MLPGGYRSSPFGGVGRPVFGQMMPPRVPTAGVVAALAAAMLPLAVRPQI